MIIGFSRCLRCNIIGLTVTVIFVVPAVGFGFIHFPVASDIIEKNKKNGIVVNVYRFLLYREYKKRCTKKDT